MEEVLVSLGLKNMAQAILLNDDVILSLSIRAQATSKKVITKEEWEKKLNDVKIRKEDMNKLVMNFLVTEGYVDAAEKFRMESGTERILSFQWLTFLFVIGV